MNLFSGLSSLLAFISLILVAISLATSFWVRISSPRIRSDLNPTRINDELGTPVVQYDIEHFGLWVACYKDKKYNETSCGYVGNQCYADICWIKTMATTNDNDEDNERTCANERVKTIDNCAAYQAVRVLAILGTIFLIVGASLLMVSSCFSSRGLIGSGALLTFLASLLLMIGFAVWIAELYKQPGLDDIGKLGWSFILFIVAWPLALIASLLACLAAARSKGQQSAYEDDVSQ